MPTAVTASRRKVITVIGSGDEINDDLAQSPFEVGRWIAAAGFHLLTGGGEGVMAAVSRGFCSVPHDGLSIGVIPAGKPAGKYPNPWVELPIVTHLRGANPRGPDSRNHINVLTADAVVAFPGRGGTRAELELSLELRVRRGTLPIIACLRAGERIGGLTAEAVAALGVHVVPMPQAVCRFLADALAAR